MSEGCRMHELLSEKRAHILYEIEEASGVPLRSAVMSESMCINLRMMAQLSKFEGRALQLRTYRYFYVLDGMKGRCHCAGLG